MYFEFAAMLQPPTEKIKHFIYSCYMFILGVDQYCVEYASRNNMEKCYYGHNNLVIIMTLLENCKMLI